MRDRFICGDSLGPEGIAALPDKSVDHVCTDPPFSAHVHDGNRRGWEIGPGGVPRPTRAMPMAFDALADDEIPCIAAQLVRVTKGWILVFCAIEQVGTWQAALVAAGARRRNTTVVTGRAPVSAERLAAMRKALLTAGFGDGEIAAAMATVAGDACVWTKSNAAPKFQGDGPAAACEPFVAVWAGTGASKWNAGGSYGHYHFPVDNGARVERRHETQKPLEVIRQILIDFTMPGDLILDPFAGGASTPIAAKQTGRSWLAWELDARPYQLGLDALERARVMTPAQLRAYHRVRKDRAYAGLPPKLTALPMQQVGLDFGAAPSPGSLAAPPPAAPSHGGVLGLVAHQARIEREIAEAQGITTEELGARWRKRKGRGLDDL
jgi:hypothetical protein